MLNFRYIRALLKTTTKDQIFAAKMSTEAIQKVLATRKFANVLDTRMSYLDTEKHSERAVVFLHGIPTAAYLWRAVIPHVQGQARCLAPDLVGMGHSDKVKDTTK